MSESNEVLEMVLKEVLPNLSNVQLKTLEDHISMLRTKSRAERSLNEDQAEFYDVLVSRMRRFTIGGVTKMEGKSTLPRARGFNRKLFVEGFEKLIEFWKPMNLNRSETTRMYVLYSDSLILYVKRVHPEELGLKKIVECLGRVGEVLDFHFPGYFDGGLETKKSRAASRLWLNR